MRHISRYPAPCFITGAVLAAILLGGCTPFAKKPLVDQAQVKQFADRGYDSGIDYETSTTRSAPDAGNMVFHVTVIQPVPEGKYPLVIYLPGLGETADAAASMRGAWAKSGYVVLSIQPLKSDADVWSSDAARNRDYTFLRHEMYSSGIVSERLEMLSKLLAYLKQPAASNDPVVQHMDLSRIAIAGFDIGAYSAMLVAGEAPQNVSFAGLPLRVGGVMALSPYADFTGSDFGVRYQKINMPVLSVTSDTDSDMRGSVPPSLHQAPFRYMPPGNKYLLVLSDASHAVIGNEDLTKPASPGTDSPQSESGGSDGDSDSGGSNRRRKKSSGGQSGAVSASVRGSSGSPTRRAMLEVASEQISTAFLNAYIKNDRYSQSWLKNDAQSWLKKMGQLEEK